MKKVLLIVIGLFVFIQIIPIGREHSNPEIVTTPKWDSKKTKDLFDGACKDCHSNYTDWPWYANVAPASWLIQHDVYEGREHFNVSAGPVSPHQVEEAVEELEKGKMPLAIYVPLHSEADLSEEDKQALVNGIKNTFRVSGYSGESENSENEPAEEDTETEETEE